MFLGLLIVFDAEDNIFFLKHCYVIPFKLILPLRSCLLFFLHQKFSA